MAVLSTKLVNVASPFTAITVVVPIRPAGVEEIVTGAVLFTMLPDISSIITITGGNVWPAVPLLANPLSERCVAGGGLIVKPNPSLRPE